MAQRKIALIIDDNRLNNDILVTLLHNQDIEPIAIESPRLLDETLAQMTNQPDIIFLDLEFPNDDGFEVLQTIKARPELNSIPVIAYSVHTSEISRARNAGFDGFLGKPINAQAFNNNVQNILMGRTIWEA